MSKQIARILESGNFEPPENLTPERYAEVPVGTVFAAGNGNIIQKTWYGCLLWNRVYADHGGAGSELFGSELTRGLGFNFATLERLDLYPAAATPASCFERTTKLYFVPASKESLLLSCRGTKGSNVELSLDSRIIELGSESYRRSVLVNPQIERALKNPSANLETITVLMASDQPYYL